jgi:hypothetical protein
VGSLKKNTTLEYSTRVVQEGDRRCEKSTLNDLAYLTPLRIPLINPVNEFSAKVHMYKRCSRGQRVQGAISHRIYRIEPFLMTLLRSMQVDLLYPQSCRERNLT